MALRGPVAKGVLRWEQWEVEMGQSQAPGDDAGTPRSRGSGVAERQPERFSLRMAQGGWTLAGLVIRCLS